MLFNQAEEDELFNLFGKTQEEVITGLEFGNEYEPLNGLSYNRLKEKILANIQTSCGPTAKPDYRLEKIQELGPAVAVFGRGLNGTNLRLTEKSWAMLREHVIIRSERYQDYEERTITIGGELVYCFKANAPERNGTFGLSPWEFKGRTPEECHFFDFLFRLPFFHEWRGGDCLSHAAFVPKIYSPVNTIEDF